MKNLLIIALSTITLATACKKDEDNTPATMQLSATLSGNNEVPTPITSPGTGAVTGTYNPTTRVLTYSVSYSGITPTAGHFHYGDTRHANPTGIMVTFTDVTTSPITGSATLSAMQADSLLSGHIYANLHTADHKAGAIRSNVMVK